MFQVSGANSMQLAQSQTESILSGKKLDMALFITAMQLLLMFC